MLLLALISYDPRDLPSWIPGSLALEEDTVTKNFIGVVGAILAWGSGFSSAAIWLLAGQVVASAVSIILGVKNPLPAAAEEIFVCLSLKYINYGYLFTAIKS
jgi:hypothetical protein